MSYNIVLNSSNVVGINNNTYQYNFIQGAFDIPDDSEIQLCSATIPYSMQNVTSQIGNNSFGYVAPSISSNVNLLSSVSGNVVGNILITTSVAGTSTFNLDTNTAISGFNLPAGTYIKSYVANSGTNGGNPTKLGTYILSNSQSSITASSASYQAILVDNQTIGIITNGVLLSAGTTPLYDGGLNLLDGMSADALCAWGYTGGTNLYNTYQLNGINSIPSTKSASNTNATIAGNIVTLTGATTGTFAVGQYVFTGSNVLCSMAKIVSIQSSTQFTTDYALVNNGAISAYNPSSLITIYTYSNISTIKSNLYGTYYPIALSNGFYTITDINASLQATLKANGHYWYNTNPIFIQGTLGASTGSGATLTVTSTLAQSNTLPIGSTVSGANGSTANFFFGTITAQLTATTYTVTSTSSWSAISTAQAFQVSNNNEIMPQITYPLSLSTNSVNYENQVSAIVVPIASNIPSVFSVGWQQANGYDGQSTWSGIYPSSSGYCFQIVMPTTTAKTTTIGNLLGFTTGAYPSTYSGYADPTKQVVAVGNSLSASPPFAPLGSTVNGIIVRCNLVDNPIGMPSDILQCIPINTTYGSNINYVAPNERTGCKMKKGRFPNILISLYDQNNNPLVCLDPNILITLLVKFNRK